MGMFSYDCLRCKHPMLGRMAVNKINSWMVDVVALLPGGTRAVGEYDGYGHVDDLDISSNTAGCYHAACWEAAGKPEYTEPSPGSNDQGWFFDNGVHDLPKPEVSDA